MQIVKNTTILYEPEYRSLWSPPLLYKITNNEKS